MFSELIATVKVPEPLVVTPEIVLDPPTKWQVSEILRPGITEEEAQRAIFGDHFEAAMGLFNNRPREIWNAFMTRYNSHFFGDGDSGK